jgi:hypothetical protein
LAYERDVLYPLAGSTNGADAFLEKILTNIEALVRRTFDNREMYLDSEITRPANTGIVK